MLHIYYSHPIHNYKNKQDNQVNINNLTELIQKIENIPEEDIVCYVNGKENIMNDIEEIIIEKFKKENMDIIFAGKMIQPLPKYNNIYTTLYNTNTIPIYSHHKYLSSVGFIGYKPAVKLCLQYIFNENRENRENRENNLTEYFLNKENHKIMKMMIDTKTSIFLNMRLVGWKDIWFQNGQIYNRILEETPCFVNFSYSWQTTNQENIVPICLEKMKQSQHVHLPLNINKYESIYNAKKQFIEPPFEHTQETNRILSNLSKIVYINLDKRTDRKDEIEEELAKYGMNSTLLTDRFAAIATPGRGIVGCTYSHLAVYKLAKQRGYKNVLVLEDDFVFIAKKHEVYENLRRLFDEQVNFDVCMLAYNNTQTALPTEYDFLLKTVEAQAASAYIVNETMYDRIIELFEWAAPLLEQTDQHWIYANDQVWKRLQSDPQIKWYCFKQRLGKQQDGYSDNSQQFMELMEH